MMSLLGYLVITEGYTVAYLATNLQKESYTIVNPEITNHGFTGHRMNNTGTNNLGLIYMNARCYMPEIGRFISPDTIVPEPGA
mgnify:CR=1 FL=1